MRRRDLALVAVINLAWAGNTVAVKLAVGAVAPFTAAFLRYAIVLAICLPWLRWVPGRMRPLLGAALAQGALWIALLNLAFARAANIASLSIVGQLGVPFSLVLAVLFLGERIHRTRVIAIAAAMAGVAVIGFDPRLAGEGSAIPLTMAAALMYAGGAVLLRGLGDVNPFTIFAWIGLIAVPMLGAASLAFEPGALAHAARLPWTALWPIAYSAIVSSIVGHAGMTFLYGRYPVSTLAPLLIPSPVLGSLCAVVFLSDPVTPRLVLGTVIVMGAVAVITLRTSRPVQAAAA